MALGGSGGVLGDLLVSVIGAPPSAGGMFAKLGEVIAAWAPANIQVNPGAMAATAGDVQGIGTFSVSGSPEELRDLFCTALTIPVTATDSRATWLATAQALIDHFSNYGQANGLGFHSGVPMLTGAGTVQWASPVFIPPLAVSLGVTDPVAAAGLLAFETGLLNHIKTNASVVALSLSGPPLSAPSDGAVSGTGTIA